MLEFISKSADPNWLNMRHLRDEAIESRRLRGRDKKEAKIIEVDKKKEVYIIGQMNDDFKHFGISLGFNVKEHTTFQFELFNSSYLIYYEATSTIFRQKISSFNFALSYGIPIIWIHSYITPVNWMNQFKGIYVGEVDEKKVWRQICGLV